MVRWNFETRTDPSTIVTKRRQAGQSIPIHNTVSSEQIALDEIEHRHIKQLPKIKNGLSLYALKTNIEWDSNRNGNDVLVLAGEVSIPERRVQRTCVIEKGGRSECEITDKLWRMIEG